MTMDKPVLVGVGDVVQLDPATTENPAFRGCLMVVTEIKPWGVQGYVQALGDTRDAPGGQAYYRAQWGTFEETGGRAVWMVESADALPAQDTSSGDDRYGTPPGADQGKK
jgi:hypothetical protein